MSLDVYSVRIIKYYYHQDLPVHQLKTLQTGLPPLDIFSFLLDLAHNALFFVSLDDQMTNLNKEVTNKQGKSKAKDKNTHRSKVVYKGDCSCGDDYIGVTVRNLAVHIAEYSNPAQTSEPAKHLLDNPSHSFTWRVLSSAQTLHKRRIIEGLMIQQFRPSLNKQVTSYVSKLFPLGIT